MEAVPGAPGRWNIKTAEGVAINVRSVSSSTLPDGSKPRWTLEIVKDKKLNDMIGDKAAKTNQKREIKFK